MSLDGGMNMNRRSFLKGLTATGAAAAAGALPEVARAAPGYEKSPLLPEDIAFVNKLKSDPAVLAKFREKPTWQQALSMLRVLAREDTKALEKKEKQLHKGAMELFDKRGNFIGQGTRLRIAHAPLPGMSVYRYVVVTGEHVVEEGALAPGGGVWVKHPKYDVAACEISEKDATLKGGLMPDALDFDMEDTEDVSWKIGTVQGRDNDSGVFEHKSHPSMISATLSSQIIFNAIHISTETANGKRMPIVGEEMRLSVIPSSETKPNAKGHLPQQGMSGAGFIRDGKLEGIASATVEQSFGEEKYSLEFIVDSAFIRETIQTLFKKRPSIANVRTG